MHKVVLAVMAAVAVLLIGSPVAAHTELVDSDPKDGSTLATAPRSVTLTFSEDVRSGHVAVTAPDGSPVKASSVRPVGARLTADLAASDQRGSYSIAYRVVSGDGHPVTGELMFTTTAGRAVEQVDDAPRDESFVGRNRNYLVLGLAAAVLAVGLILAPLRRGRDA